MHNALISNKLSFRKSIKIEKINSTSCFGVNPVDPSGRGSIYEDGYDAQHHGHAHARASCHCDHEDGYAYLRYDNTFAFHLRSVELSITF